MVIKLNIWKNQKEIDKTYMIDSFDIMWGTIEDLIEVIDLNEFANQLTSNGMSNTALINMVASALTNSRDLINNTLKDIFVGLTDEELKRIKLKELINVALQLITGSVNIMQDLGKNSKNVQGRQ